MKEKFSLILVFYCFYYLNVFFFAEVKAIDRDIQKLNERIDRLEDIFYINSNRRSEDISHLELIWETMKTSILNSVPPTDEMCKFNYTVGRCYPRCSCSFQLQPGDYTPSRACRKIPSDRIDPLCNNSIGEDDEPWRHRIKKRFGNKAHKFLEFLRKHSPESDEECSWDFRAFDCVPSHDCYFHYKLGDFSPHRSCRIINDLYTNITRFVSMEQSKIY
mmetsp:Transcript_6144/g.6339  ORF Transcript_6144/g.6339 Transcript_6144/m.6339 type:complete len:218 (+) Transcript_6144:253-906(+)